MVIFATASGTGKNGKGSSHHEVDVDSSQTSCRLEDLQPGTAYSFNIVVKSEDGQESPPSATIDFTTERHEIRFAEMIQRKCNRIGNRNGMDLYGVPLVKSSGTTVERYTFGKADNKQNVRMQHRTILVMGATGSGKTTLINGMINYIFNVIVQLSVLRNVYGTCMPTSRIDGSTSPRSRPHRPTPSSRSMKMS